MKANCRLIQRERDLQIRRYAIVHWQSGTALEIGFSINCWSPACGCLAFSNLKQAGGDEGIKRWFAAACCNRYTFAIAVSCQSLEFVLSDF